MLKVDNNWTLFLDRDGVINHRIPGAYVRYPEEFAFEKGALSALAFLAEKMQRIVVVTNQQGVGAGLMTMVQLEEVHAFMMEEIKKESGRIDGVYACTELSKNNPFCRKPNPGMAHQAQKDFPEIDFHKSIIVGDSISDMEFGQNLGMTTVFVKGKKEEEERAAALNFDFRVDSLSTFAELLKSPI